MMNSRDIQNKNDWFYEFRPFIYFILGLIGLVNTMTPGTSIFVRIGQVSGLVLIGIAWRIHLWRKTHRKFRRVPKARH